MEPRQSMESRQPMVSPKPIGPPQPMELRQLGRSGAVLSTPLLVALDTVLVASEKLLHIRKIDVTLDMVEPGEWEHFVVSSSGTSTAEQTGALVFPCPGAAGFEGLEFSVGKEAATKPARACAVGQSSTLDINAVRSAQVRARSSSPGSGPSRAPGHPLCGSSRDRRSPQDRAAHGPRDVQR